MKFIQLAAWVVLEVVLLVTVLLRFEVHPDNYMWLSTLHSYA